MPNLFDYIHWRGDMSFSERSFNELDAAIFSMLSYLDWKDIVPPRESKDKISITEVSAEYFSKYQIDGSKPRHISLTNPTIEEMLKVLAECSRFQNVFLSRFDEDTDFSIGRQFAAVTFTLPKVRPENVVVYRGTDLTFVGWKEDLDMVYMEQIPAQESAQRYLEHLLKKQRGRFIVCGHSKGGNLAVYAASHIRSFDQRRISAVYNFDGPGFDFSLIDRTPFDVCQSKILNLVPVKSVVGMLLESVGTRTVISSSARYPSQHNLFQWDVDCMAFTRGALTETAQLVDRTITSWLKQISLNQREAFIGAVFDLLGASEGTQLSTDPIQNLTEMKSILQKYTELDKETRAMLNQVLLSLTNQTKETLTTTIKQKLPTPQGKG